MSLIKTLIHDQGATRAKQRGGQRHVERILLFRVHKLHRPNPNFFADSLSIFRLTICDQIWSVGRLIPQPDSMPGPDKFPDSDSFK